MDSAHRSDHQDRLEYVVTALAYLNASAEGLLQQSFESASAARSNAAIQLAGPTTKSLELRGAARLGLLDRLGAKEDLEAAIALAAGPLDAILARRLMRKFQREEKTREKPRLEELPLAVRNALVTKLSPEELRLFQVFALTPSVADHWPQT